LSCPFRPGARIADRRGVLRHDGVTTTAGLGTVAGGQCYARYIAGRLLSLPEVSSRPRLAATTPRLFFALMVPAQQPLVALLGGVCGRPALVLLARLVVDPEQSPERRSTGLVVRDRL